MEDSTELAMTFLWVMIAFMVILGVATASVFIYNLIYFRL